MAKGKTTTSLACDASVATSKLCPRVAAMDNLSQALGDLRGTVQALYAVDTHMIEPSDTEDAETCRNTLMRLLMADLGLVEAAERNAWTAVVVERSRQTRGEG